MQHHAPRDYCYNIDTLTELPPIKIPECVEIVGYYKLLQLCLRDSIGCFLISCILGIFRSIQTDHPRILSPLKVLE